VLATRPRVIVVDDDAAIRQALRVLLTGEGYDVEVAQAPHEALAVACKGEFDVALVDLNYTRDTTSGAEGMDLLGRLLEHVPDLPVIVMTAWASLEGAVEAVRRGARDYLEKPWDSERLLRQIAALSELSQAHRYRRNLEERQRRTRRRGLPELVFESAAMSELMDVVRRVAPSDAAILITGEHGTGKELVAQLVHESSKRSDGPLVAVNAGAMADGVLESELFGHVRGAFTDARDDRAGCYELAHGGTLFLDELGTMPVTQQTKLLRVLETGEFRPVGSSRTRTADVRIVSATNADLIALADAGAIRHDLLYRLNTVVLTVPPLRERREDIPVLAMHFLARESRRYDRSFDGFTPAAHDALNAHRWPGNVRELEHAVERAVLLARGVRIDAEDLALGQHRAPRIVDAASPVEREDAAWAGLDGLRLEDVEARLIARALERFEGNVNLAAEALGLSRSALYRRLQQQREPS
jgi:DNA-binding NtrC family response regulator